MREKLGIEKDKRTQENEKARLVLWDNKNGQDKK